MVIGSHNEENCKKAADELSRIGKTFYVCCDVSKESDVQALIERTVKKFGRIDIMVNNAGIYFPKRIEEMSEEDFERALAVNLNGVLWYKICCN